MRSYKSLRTDHGGKRLRPSHQAWPSVRTRFALALLAGLLISTTPAPAAKWHHCPSQLRYYSARIGAVSSPFIHPGHEIGIFLSDQEMAYSGAFSTDPDGNTVTVGFASLFGPSITLPPMTVTAVSPATLYFAFPDTRQMLGHPLAGPVEILVTTGGRTTAEIDPRHLVALSPSTDAGALATGELQQGALATMDTRGSIWAPVDFSAFGTMRKNMPTCPGIFTPLRGYAVGVTVRSVPSLILGAAQPTYPPLRAVKRLDVFVGDFIVNGTNYYGNRVGNLAVFPIPHGLGVMVCARNDAPQVVLRAVGWRRWTRPWSPFRAWMPSSQPMEIQLSRTSVSEMGSGLTGLDAFGAECLVQ